MIGPAHRDSLRNVHFLCSQPLPRKSPAANGGAKVCPAPDGFREQNRREKTRSAQLLLQTRVGRHRQSDSGSASPRCIVSNLRAIGIFLCFPDELPSCARQRHPAHVRNIVSDHFVAFIGSGKKKPRQRGASTNDMGYFARLGPESNCPSSAIAASVCFLVTVPTRDCGYRARDALPDRYRSGPRSGAESGTYHG